jgi:hypothetical protein
VETLDIPKEEFPEEIAVVLDLGLLPRGGALTSLKVIILGVGASNLRLSGIWTGDCFKVSTIGARAEEESPTGERLVLIGSETRI